MVRIRKGRGFSMVELLVVVAILGILATVVSVAVIPLRKKGRDVKRKSEIAQIGRFFSGSGTCFVPEAGDGVYDLADLFDEVVAKNPQVAKMIKKAPQDPASESEDESLYMYEVTDGGKKCVLYANLEYDKYSDDEVTLKTLTEPTPGGGNGILQASEKGWNGTGLYVQASN